MRAILISASILAVATGCAGVGAFDPGAPDTYAMYRSPSRHVAQPWLFGEPKYPKAELAQGIAGEVVVDARVSSGGELQDVRIGPGAASSAAFADSVRDAIPLWRFYPPLDANCQPTDERILVRMSFRVENGKPHIVVAGEGPAWSGDGQPQPISTRQAAYPRKTSYFRWDEGVTVFAKATIDAQGNVTGTTAKAYPRGLPWLMMSFEDQARIAILDFKFSPVSSTAPRYYCTDVIFAAYKQGA